MLPLLNMHLHSQNINQALHESILFCFTNDILQKHTDILLQIYVGFPKPTHFQCVYHMCMSDCILCCEDGQV